MSIRDIFLAGVETAFDVFNDAVKTAQYTLIVDNGFDDATEVLLVDRRIIKENFTKEDVETLSFSDEIQPTDVKGLIPFVDITGDVNPGDTVLIEDDLLGNKTFTVVAFELDPMSVLYTFLLRKV